MKRAPSGKRQTPRSKPKRPVRWGELSARVVSAFCRMESNFTKSKSSLRDLIHARFERQPWIRELRIWEIEGILRRRLGRGRMVAWRRAARSAGR